MARISGVELPENTTVGYALTRIRGIGWTTSQKLLASIRLDMNKRVKDLSAEDIAKITANVDDLTTEGELAKSVRTNVNRLQVIGSYRGLRHTRGLPTRGQRTKTNARTKRGKRKTVGAFKKEILAKQKAAE